MNQDFLKGAQGKVSIMSWSSSKLRRVARSSSAAETQAANSACEELEFTRLVWAEFENEAFNVQDAWKYIASVPGVLVVDAKDLFDSTARSESSGLQDRRTAIEVLALRQALSWGHTGIRWVHSKAQLADVLTKASHVLVERTACFMWAGTWRLVEDPLFVSARKRTEAGIGDLDELPESMRAQRGGEPSKSSGVTAFCLYMCWTVEH